MRQRGTRLFENLAIIYKMANVGKISSLCVTS